MLVASSCCSLRGAQVLVLQLICVPFIPAHAPYVPVIPGAQVLVLQLRVAESQATVEALQGRLDDAERVNHFKAHELTQLRNKYKSAFLGLQVVALHPMPLVPYTCICALSGYMGHMQVLCLIPAFVPYRSCVYYVSMRYKAQYLHMPHISR